MDIHAGDDKEWLTMARGTPAGAIGRGTGWEAGIRLASARSHGGGTAWVAEEILSTSEQIGEDRAAR